MKKVNMMKGFTLVELLIVIALIAILSVGVLATINPVEQRNKAADANTSNDAGEVLNAYERYYTNQAKYPWMVTDSSIDVDDAWYAKSNDVGFGLCTNATLGSDPAHTTCSTYDAAGALIASDELKDSFLQKGYGKHAGEIGFNDNNTLFLVKQPAAQHNSLYVCFIPKAKSNRTVSNNLKMLAVDANNRPTQIIDASAAEFDASGNPLNTTGHTWDFTDPAHSLFKCVP